MVYGDVYFIVNFSMDFVSLFIASRVTKNHIGTLRASIASALGAVYAILALFLEKMPIVSVFCSILVPFIMCLIAFGAKRVKSYLVCTGVFFGTSFLMGGIISTVFLAVNKYIIGRGVYINGTLDTLYSELPLWGLFLVAAVAAAFSMCFEKIAMRRTLSRREQVRLEDGGRCVEFTALTDSGNLLTDPIGGRAVIVVTKKVARELLPHRAYRVFEKNDLASIDSIDLKKVRIIPVRTACGEGVMLGYIPDAAYISGISRSICVALDTSGEDFDGCEGIVPSEFL